MRIAPFLKFLVAFILLLGMQKDVFAQRPSGGGRPFSTIPGSGMFNQGSSSGPFKDSLLHRTGFEDSVTVLYYTIANPDWKLLDTTIDDFFRRWPVPWSSVSNGNYGSAVLPLVFQPFMRAGWDHGFHAFDPYMSDLENIPFYYATRPFTQLNYILGSKTEQTIQALHTQNIRPGWNFSFRYQMMNVPGMFKNQKNSHNNFVFTNNYQSKNKRYGLHAVIASDKIGASENGGLKDLSQLSNIPSFADRFNIPTNFGGSEFQQQNFLSSNIITGNRYKASQFFLSQYCNIGSKLKQKKDTSMPAENKGYFTLEHSFKVSRYQFLFEDPRVDNDSYQKYYGISQVPDTFLLKDQWLTLKNNFNISRRFSGDEKKYLTAGISYEYFQLDTGLTRFSFSTFVLNGSGQFQTRNKQWDVQVNGLLYLAGYFSGDYELNGSLRKDFSKSKSFVRLGFSQVNRTPSFVFDRRSSFRRLAGDFNDLRKENTTLFSFRYEKPVNHLYFEFRSFSILNYAYFDGYNSAKQSNQLFNLFQLQTGRKFLLKGRWFLYSDLILQQTAGNAPVNVPLFLTRNRLAFEGKFFKNLKLSTGIELRYNTPFKANGYSPLNGQFFYQNDSMIRNRPDIALYCNASIRRMDFFIRVENLNAFQFSPAGFYNNNFATPLQPVPGLYSRLGIFWRFVN